jgi:hypothetical protein
LAEDLSYDPETGRFTDRRTGREVGSIRQTGYRYLSIRGYRIMAHRAAWLMHYGTLPAASIDHANGIPDDNRIANLRLASPQQQCANRVSSARAKGFYRKRGRIYARVKHDGKHYNAGPFATESEATAWYHAKASELRGDFYRGLVA